MAVGSLGDVVFEVSDDRKLTFSGMSYSVGARTSVHNRINGRPLIEFQGPENEEISLTIKLSAFLGINPRKSMYKLDDMCREGVPVRWVIGKMHFGKYKWLITRVSNSIEHVSNRGQLLSITTKLTLKEYAKR